MNSLPNNNSIKGGVAEYEDEIENDDESTIYGGSDGDSLEDDENKSVLEDEENISEENEELMEGEEEYSESSDEEETDDYLENRLKKISKELKTNIMQDFHTELNYRNVDEIELMATVSRNVKGEIIDPLHKTIPILTKYEKARILGERARQIEEGSQPCINIKPEIIDSYVIAQMELKEKAIPFIIERPLPNGGCEYWRLADLEFVL
jgi:hypothetical protein